MHIYFEKWEINIYSQKYILNIWKMCTYVYNAILNVYDIWHISNIFEYKHTYIAASLYLPSIGIKHVFRMRERMLDLRPKTTILIHIFGLSEAVS